jgi:hypothetical protein
MRGSAVRKNFGSKTNSPEHPHNKRVTGKGLLPFRDALKLGQIVQQLRRKQRKRENVAKVAEARPPNHLPSDG